MADPSPRRSTPFFVAVLGAVVLLTPCLYVASVGPVIRYLDRPSLEPLWKVVYAPLEWAHRETPLRTPLELYVGLWADIAPGPGD